MNIVMDKKLAEYMRESNKKDIVVFTARCNSWGGSYVEVSARFAAENEKLNEDNYNVMETEVGKLYLPRSSVKFEDKIVLARWKFLWMDGIQIYGVKAVA